MQKKRFLTAVEVFQLFGVDADALEKLIASGDVQQLPDRGSFKYRSEDFANLVKKGKLSPRTAGEMFQVDDDGDMPFLKIDQKDDKGLKFDEEVFLLDIDEDALNEQAKSNRNENRPPIVAPDTWYSDDDIDISALTKPTTDEGTIPKRAPKYSEDQTEVELRANSGSDSLKGTDSDIRLVFEDDEINLNDPDLGRSGSDSDVRLEGSITSSRKSPQDFASDSDVRLMSDAHQTLGSDSDVMLVSDPEIPIKTSSPRGDSDVKLADPRQTKPDSDSDVTLSKAKPIEEESSEEISIAAPESDSDVVLLASSHELPVVPALQSDSDSDVTLAGADEQIEDDDATEDGISLVESDSDVMLIGDSGKAHPSPSHERAPQKSLNESDSDVQLAGATNSETLGGDSDIRLFESILEAAPDSDIKLSDGDISVDEENVATEPGEFNVFDIEESQPAAHSVPESMLEATEPEFVLEPASEEIEVVEPALDLGKTQLEDFGIELDEPEPVSAATDKTIDMAFSEDEIPIELVASDSDVEVVDVESEDSGITLDDSAADSGISLATEDDDSGIQLTADHDSEIRLQPIDAGSGISLEEDSADSGIMLEQSDSGIRFEPVSEDSGISLIETDSGISLMDEDSGIALEDDDVHELDEFASSGEMAISDSKDDLSATAQIDLSEDVIEDSAFDVSLAESGDTMEIASLDDESDAPSGRSKKGSKKSMNLSDAFQLDESIEVEDLDISNDLDDAPVEAASEEFAALDDEVLDVDDEHFGSETLSVVADDDDDAAETLLKSDAKAVKKKVSNEPAWGMLAVAPIIAASVFMAVTSTILVGGMATMWKGGEVSGPAGMLISMLAGLI